MLARPLHWPADSFPNIRKDIMLKRIALAACTVLLAGNLFAAENPRVLLTTSLGEIELELEAEKAPISVENFLGYVDSGFYDGTVFHRVIPGLLVQGGGFGEGLTRSAEHTSELPSLMRNSSDVIC